MAYEETNVQEVVSSNPSTRFRIYWNVIYVLGLEKAMDAEF